MKDWLTTTGINKLLIVLRTNVNKLQKQAMFFHIIDASIAKFDGLVNRYSDDDQRNLELVLFMKTMIQEQSKQPLRGKQGGVNNIWC